MISTDNSAASAIEYRFVIWVWDKRNNVLQVQVIDSFVYGFEMLLMLLTGYLHYYIHNKVSAKRQHYTFIKEKQWKNRKD